MTFCITVSEKRTGRNGKLVRVLSSRAWYPIPAIGQSSAVSLAPTHGREGGQKGGSMKVKNYRDVKAEPITGETGVMFRWLSDERAETSDCGLCLYEIEPGAFSMPQTHYRERQVFVLAGAGTVRGEGSESPLGVGDVVCVPPTEQHRFVNRGQEMLRLLVVIQMPRLVTLAGTV